MSSLTAVTAGVADLAIGQVRVRVPATSANLGPGYDCFGLALDLYDEVVAARSAGGLQIDVVGVGADSVARDERNLVATAAARGFAALGESMPPLTLTCTNMIPHGSGQGSSAAAVVSGILLARALCDRGEQRLSDGAVFDLATDMEGHPDNVAPALWGGFTIAWTSASAADSDASTVADRHARAVCLAPHPDLEAVVWTADQFCATEAARAALPAMVPHRDAAENSAHAALLVHAISADPSLLLQATQDRLHQPYRAAVMPRTAALLGSLRARGIAAVLSGAGPSVLALGRDLPPIETLSADGFRARRLVPTLAGARVERCA